MLPAFSINKEESKQTPVPPAPARADSQTPATSSAGIVGRMDLPVSLAHLSVKLIKIGRDERQRRNVRSLSLSKGTQQTAAREADLFPCKSCSKFAPTLPNKVPVLGINFKSFSHAGENFQGPLCLSRLSRGFSEAFLTQRRRFGNTGKGSCVPELPACGMLVTYGHEVLMRTRMGWTSPEVTMDMCDVIMEL